MIELAFAIARTLPTSQRGPARPCHVIHSHHSVAKVVRHVDPARAVNEDSVRPAKLVDPIAPSTQCRPTCPRHVVYPNNTGVTGVREVDPARLVNEDPGVLRKLH